MLSSVPLESVGKELHSALSAVLKIVSGQSIREREVVRLVPGVDRTTIGRVVRAVRAADPYLVLHHVPAPTALKALLGSLSAHIPRPLLQAAHAATDRYRVLIESLPGGRSSLDAVLASVLPEAERRAHATARQSVFRAMSSIMGCQAIATSSAMFIHPAAGGEWCDSLIVLGRYGITRFRPGVPLPLLGVKIESSGKPSVEPLGGPEHAGDPWSFFLPEFCEGDANLRVDRRSDSDLVVTIPGDQPEPGRSATVVYAQMIKGNFERYRTRDDPWSWCEVVHKIPSRVSVIDLFVHHSLVSEVPPTITGRSLDSSARRARPTQTMELQVDSIETGASIVAIGRGVGRTSHPELPQYPELLATATKRAGWNCEEFIGHRVAWKHPLLSTSLTIWFMLPEDGRSGIATHSL